MEKRPLRSDSIGEAAAPSAPPVEHVTHVTRDAEPPVQNAYNPDLAPAQAPAPLYPPISYSEESANPGSSQMQFVPMPPPPSYSEAIANPVQQTPAVVVPIQHPQTRIIVDNTPRCQYCGGQFEMTRDTCCLVTIILCLVFCCPIGMIMLYCIPCTNQRKCISCQRIG